LRFPFACLANKRRKLVRMPVGVEKLFSGNFTSKIRSQVIECSFSADAEIDRNYCFGSFFNSHGYFNNQDGLR